MSASPSSSSLRRAPRCHVCSCGGTRPVSVLGCVPLEQHPALRRGSVSAEWVLMDGVPRVLMKLHGAHGDPLQGLCLPESAHTHTCGSQADMGTVCATCVPLHTCRQADRAWATCRNGPRVKLCTLGLGLGSPWPQVPTTTHSQNQSLGCAGLFPEVHGEWRGQGITGQL